MSRHGDDPFSRALYPFLGEDGGVSEPDILADVEASTRQKVADVCALRRRVLAAERDGLVTCGRAMAERFAGGGMLLAFGNGGSATDAQDISADFLDPPSAGWRGLPALSLTNDIAVVTAVGNDVGFDNVFARQVIAFGRAGDIALGVSTSGASRNVVAALRQAARQGLLTIGLTGTDGGEMATMGLDHCFNVPSTYVPRIQEAQATIYHTLWALVHALLGRAGDRPATHPKEPDDQ